MITRPNLPGQPELRCQRRLRSLARGSGRLVGEPVDGKAMNGGVLQWTPPGKTWQDYQAIGKQLGVMFLGTQSGDQPWDIATTPADITDGMSTTLLVAENTLAGSSPGTPYSGHWETNWACPLPNFAMFLGSDDVCRTARSAGDCLGGQLAPGPEGATGKGWARANQAGTFENINFGQSLTVEGSFPFANSAHPRGANFVFCDGAVRFLSSTMDGFVYAELITPGGSRLPPGFHRAPITSTLCELRSGTAGISDGGPPPDLRRRDNRCEPRANSMGRRRP